MAQPLAPWLQPVFQPSTQPNAQPNAQSPVRAVAVAGACGNVGFGKLGQLARLLTPHGIPVVALDPSPGASELPTRLREAYGSRLEPAVVDRILANITFAKDLAELPASLRIGFMFEAIPERLPLKHNLYKEVFARDPEAFVFSATSGFPTSQLFGELPQRGRCGVLHPFFPHLTNKLWELPSKGAVTDDATLKAVRKFLGGLGMNLIEVRDVPAFAADRIFCGMMLEAVRIHADMGLSPAQVDDVCRQVLGTSPFYVHNLIPGANYLSAHCMQLMREEVDSTLFEIPAVWKPYMDDPHAQWPYAKGERCAKDSFQTAADRMLGMLMCLTAGILERDIAAADALNFLCENALAFTQGTPALAQSLGLPKARDLAQRFIETQKITAAEQVAPLQAFDAGKPGWGEVYVGTSVRDGIGLLSLKKPTLSDPFCVELDAAIERLQNDDAVRAIVVAPDGTFNRDFGHGASLPNFLPVLGKHEDALALIQRWKRTLRKLRGGKPTVAALVGRVLGGSLELATYCHARVAGNALTQLQFPETTVGVVPGLGGCHHVHRFSRPEAWPEIDEVLLTGKPFTPEQARAWGFVSEICPIAELPARSFAIAQQLADTPQSRPVFRTHGEAHTVRRDVSPTNTAGVPLDAKLREVLADAIERANAAEYDEGSRIEEEAGAESLTLSSSEIGVKAMLRGKPPKFEHPLS